MSGDRFVRRTACQEMFTGRSQGFTGDVKGLSGDVKGL